MDTGHSTSPHSDRKFGWFTVAISAAFAIRYAFKHQWPLSEALIGLAALLAIITLVRPAWLKTPNRLWFQLGTAMGRVTNPLVMGILFFALITPMAVIARWLGRDALAMRRKNSTSYWIERTPETANTAESFQHQF